MVYLLHFSIPYPNRRHAGGVQHYVGYTGQSMRNRLTYHYRGYGSKYLFAVYKSGRTIVLARRWKHGDRSVERRLKNYHGGVVQLCPFCTGRKAFKKGRYE